MKSSIFTTIPEIKDRSRADNKLAWAFLTNTPITPGHTLIAPKRVVTRYDELTEAELLAIFELTTVVRERLIQTFGAEGFNYAWNEGAHYGQSAPHFHLHIVPRTPKDEGITNTNLAKFLYRPGSREATPETELRVIVTKLRHP